MLNPIHTLGARVELSGASNPTFSPNFHIEIEKDIGKSARTEDPNEKLDPLTDTSAAKVGPAMDTNRGKAFRNTSLKPFIKTRTMSETTEFENIDFMPHSIGGGLVILNDFIDGLEKLNSMPNVYLNRTDLPFEERRAAYREFKVLHTDLSKCIHSLLNEIKKTEHSVALAFNEFSEKKPVILTFSIRNNAQKIRAILKDINLLKRRTNEPDYFMKTYFWKKMSLFTASMGVLISGLKFIIDIASPELDQPGKAEFFFHNTSTILMGLGGFGISYFFLLSEKNNYDWRIHNDEAERLDDMLESLIDAKPIEIRHICKKKEGKFKRLQRRRTISDNPHQRPLFKSKRASSETVLANAKHKKSLPTTSPLRIENAAPLTIPNLRHLNPFYTTTRSEYGGGSTASNFSDSPIGSV